MNHCFIKLMECLITFFCICFQEYIRISFRQEELRDTKMTPCVFFCQYFDGKNEYILYRNE